MNSHMILDMLSSHLELMSATATGRATVLATDSCDADRPATCAWISRSKLIVCLQSQTCYLRCLNNAKCFKISRQELSAVVHCSVRTHSFGK